MVMNLPTLPESVEYITPVLPLRRLIIYEPVL